MFSIKINVSYFILLSFVVQIQTLVELPILEDNNIAFAERAIRDTVNNLFAAFRIHGLTQRPVIKQFSTIHNFFTSITLKDCKNLKEIARLTRVNNIDNNTQRFITQLNELLDEDDKSNEVYDNNKFLTEYVNVFIRKLKYLKETDVSNENYNANPNILKYIDDYDKPFITDTEDINRTNATDDISTEFWTAPSGRRIFGSTKTAIKNFPFLASVQFFKKFQCAGSIIKSDLVITSGSCLQIAWNNRFFRENPSFLSVQVGSSYYESGGDNIPVLEIFFHPNYDPKTLRNNLAIMKLVRVIALRRGTKRVRKIDFDREPSALPVNVGNITIVGWGAKYSTNIVYNVFKNKLSYAELSFYSQKDCQEHYSKEFVTSTNFCAGYYSSGTGACSRDAGDPAIIDNLLMGVTSFGSPVCGSLDSPTVFTKLGYYTDWIEDIMEKETVRIKHETTLESRLQRHYFTKKKPKTEFTVTPFTTATEVTTITATAASKRILRIAEDQQLFLDFVETLFENDKSKESRSSEFKTPIRNKHAETDDKETNAETKKYSKTELTPIKHKHVENPINTNGDIEIITKKRKRTTTTAANKHSIISPTTRKEEKIISKPIIPTFIETSGEAREGEEYVTNEEITEKPASTDLKDTIVKNNGIKIDNIEKDLERSIENDILNLIDNLDIRKIMKLQIPSKEADDDIEQNTDSNSVKIKEPDNNNDKMKTLNKKGSKETLENISETKATTYKINEILIDEYTTQEGSEDEDNEDEEGLVIPAEYEEESHAPPPSFLDLTIRQGPNKSQMFNLLTSDDAFFDVIMAAIKERSKRQKNKKGYIL